MNAPSHHSLARPRRIRILLPAGLVLALGACVAPAAPGKGEASGPVAAYRSHWSGMEGRGLP